MIAAIITIIALAVAILMLALNKAGADADLRMREIMARRKQDVHGNDKSEVNS